MEAFLWICILVYILAVGFFLAGKLGPFLSRHHKAFPGTRHISRPAPSRDDKAAVLCYHDLITGKEPEQHEEHHP